MKNLVRLIVVCLGVFVAASCNTANGPCHLTCQDANGFVDDLFYGDCPCTSCSARANALNSSSYICRVASCSCPP